MKVKYSIAFEMVNSRVSPLFTIKLWTVTEIKSDFRAATSYELETSSVIHIVKTGLQP